MSVDLDWHALTAGEDGEALAETIRAFIHDRFQRVTLPKMIRSVKVHAFEFGSIAPEIELKDICDPLPDFYDDNEDNELSPTQEEPNDQPTPFNNDDRDTYSSTTPAVRTDPSISTASVPQTPGTFGQWPATDTQRPILSRSSTPGIPGGTSNMSYFHLPLSAGLSGAATPFAAFGGAHGWLENQHSPWHHHDTIHDSINRRLSSQSTTATNIQTMEPPRLEAIPEAAREKASEDVQIVTHVRYSGDVKLSMTADILLDYPMPSFVGIPLQLNVTGMTFDGVAIMAYIKKKAHFCFLSPEDADALLDGANHGSEDGSDPPIEARQPVGGLFEQIRVESEIGQRANGKQVLKNVGKVEKFVLEQVRKIFENEFVYPSFWTLLV